MQCFGRQILLLPAWPAGWDVEFKLHAHDITVVEGAMWRASWNTPLRRPNARPMSSSCIHNSEQNPMSEQTTIWYAEAAAQWCDALPLGERAHGDALRRRMCRARHLSDSTFWSGTVAGE